MLDNLKKVDKEIYDAIINEVKRQADKLELIASENFVHDCIMEAMGCVMTNKYAEGYPGKRYYGGCEFVDVAETIAIERACKLFNAEHANVQPHSGVQANMAVYFALLDIGDTYMGLNLSHGGHLSHGHKVSFSGKFYNVIQYNVDKETEQFNYDEIMKLAKETKPKLIMTGASAYPRIIDFKKFREIADAVGAFLVADIAHIAGLIAAGEHPSPFPWADVVTSTTHKTLRGPRSGLILCKKEVAKKIDKAVFPLIQGGPHMHTIAAKATCFKLAATEEFKNYQKQIKANAVKLAECIKDKGLRLVSGGTDTHLMLIDLRPKKVTGKVVEKVLEKAGITVNKNTIPYDPEKPFIASGIRIGTPAVTTRGMKEPEMESIADLIIRAIDNREDETELKQIESDVKELCKRFPLYENWLK